MNNLSKLSNILSVLTIFTIVCTGCKKEEEEPGNYFSYLGVDYELSKGYLENYGKLETDQDYNIDLTLLSAGITVIEQADGDVEDIEGNGHGLYFEIFTSSPDMLVPGKYVYDENAEGTGGTFDDGEILIGFDSGSGSGEIYAIVSGEINVSNRGTVYEISFDCTDENGEIITGHFKGNLKYYNYD